MGGSGFQHPYLSLRRGLVFANKYAACATPLLSDSGGVINKDWAGVLQMAVHGRVHLICRPSLALLVVWSDGGWDLSSGLSRSSNWEMVTEVTSTLLF